MPSGASSSDIRLTSIQPVMISSCLINPGAPYSGQNILAGLLKHAEAGAVLGECIFMKKGYAFVK